MNIPNEFLDDYKKYTRKECMQKYGISEWTVRRWLIKCGIVKDIKKWSDLTEMQKAAISKRQARLRAKRWSIIRELKQSPCVDCGKSFPPECMDFDHVRGVKKFNIASSPNLKISGKCLEEEIAKCDLICACCHRIRTTKRRRES